MSLVSLQFIGFVLATVILYYLVSSRYRWVILLIASIIFYVSISPWGIFVLLGTAVYTYWAALKIQNSKDQYTEWLAENKQKVDKETRKKQKNKYEKTQQWYVITVVVLSIGALFVCKYLNPMMTGINNLLGTAFWKAENILLPLGISYYSFQLISYLVDVKRDLIRAEKNPLKVILFGVFFLSIMQGPFNRYNDLMPQIEEGGAKKPTYRQIKFAILRILFGYIKKMCIADQVGLIANEVFSNYQNYYGLGIIIGIIAFAVQLYADFSGYMDIVCGIGELFGIEIPENFKQPFFARTISEFWRKWHITLGLWLQDYIFYPILKSSAWKKMGKKITEKHGKNAGRIIPTYIGMFILWTLIGLWHGAGFNYVFGVGILQFLYIFIGEVFEPVFHRVKSRLGIHEESSRWHFVQSLKCTMLMLIAWVFFKSRTFGDAIGYFRQVPASIPTGFASFVSIFSSQAKGISGARWQLELLYIIFCIVILFLVDLYNEKNEVSLREKILGQRFPVRLLCYLTLIFAILVFGAYGNSYNASQFIYFDF